LQAKFAYFGVGKTPDAINDKQSMYAAVKKKLVRTNVKVMLRSFSPCLRAKRFCFTKLLRAASRRCGRTRFREAHCRRCIHGLRISHKTQYQVRRANHVAAKLISY